MTGPIRDDDPRTSNRSATTILLPRRPVEARRRPHRPHARGRWRARRHSASRRNRS